MKKPKKITKIVLKDLLEPYLPRPYTHKRDIISLAESIKEYGLLDNIILNITPKGLKPIGGNRRIKALEHLGVKTIPSTKYPNKITMERVVLLEVSEEEADKLAIAHNLQRKDLTGVEYGENFKKLMDKYGWTQEYLANVIDKSQEFISNKIRLLSLPDKVKEAIIAYAITPHHGRLLLSVRSLWKYELKSDEFNEEYLEKTIKGFQDRLFEECLKKKWSTTKLAEEIDDIRAMFVRLRQQCKSEIEGRISTTPYGGWKSWTGEPVYAWELCDTFNLHENGNSQKDLEFIFKYVEKYGLDKEDKELKKERIHRDYDAEKELEDQIRELEAQLEVLRTKKHVKETQKE